MSKTSIAENNRMTFGESLSTLANKSIRRAKWPPHVTIAVGESTVEPMLEEVSLAGMIDGISQVIIGGESGPNARPFHLEWARSLIDQCREAGVKVFMKQTGSNAWHEGKPFKTKHRSGADIAEWPEWAQIQQFPEVRNA